MSTPGAAIDSHHCCCEDAKLCPGHCELKSKNYNQQWSWNATTRYIQVMNERRSPGLCLEAKEARAGAELQLAQCDPSRDTEQQWFLNQNNKSLPLIRLFSLTLLKPQCQGQVAGAVRGCASVFITGQHLHGTVHRGAQLQCRNQEFLQRVMLCLQRVMLDLCCFLRHLSAKSHCHQLRHNVNYSRSLWSWL